MELITHIEKCVKEFLFSNVSCYDNYLKVIFVLFDICDLCLLKKINKVRFKNKIIQLFSDAQEQNDDRYKVLIPGMQDRHLTDER